MNDWLLTIKIQGVSIIQCYQFTYLSHQRCIPLAIIYFYFKFHLTGCFCSSPCPSMWMPRCQHEIRALQFPLPPPPPNLTHHLYLMSSLLSYLAGLSAGGLSMTLQNRVLLSPFYFLIYITSFFIVFVLHSVFVLPACKVSWLCHKTVSRCFLLLPHVCVHKDLSYCYAIRHTFQKFAFVVFDVSWLRSSSGRFFLVSVSQFNLLSVN